jgi:IS30 family transposase
LGAGVEDRPEAAEAREEFGHWEIDSAAGKKSGKSAVPAIVERKARIQIAAELGGRGSGAADAAAGQVAGSFGEAACGAFKSAAGGNGREFAGRGGAVERAVYFRHPRSSFEKGARERHSGLPRRFAEKGEKRGRHARAADLQGGGLEQQPSQENSGLQDSCGNV